MMVVDSKLTVEKGKEIKDLNGWSPTSVDTDRSLDLSIHISLLIRWPIAGKPGGLAMLRPGLN
jgi:hypothetical protein